MGTLFSRYEVRCWVSVIWQKRFVASHNGYKFAIDSDKTWSEVDKVFGDTVIHCNVVGDARLVLLVNWSTAHLDDSLDRERQDFVPDQSY